MYMSHSQGLWLEFLHSVFVIKMRPNAVGGLKRYSTNYYYTKTLKCNVHDKFFVMLMLRLITRVSGQEAVNISFLELSVHVFLKLSIHVMIHYCHYWHSVLTKQSRLNIHLTFFRDFSSFEIITFGWLSCLWKAFFTSIPAQFTATFNVTKPKF